MFMPEDPETDVKVNLDTNEVLTTADKVVALIATALMIGVELCLFVFGKTEFKLSVTTILIALFDIVLFYLLWKMFFPGKK